jgi:PAS domain S-box-containing protein
VSGKNPPVNRGQRKDLIVGLILLIGLSLSGLLAWSLQQWLSESQTGSSVRAAEAWGHRIGQELRNDENRVATIATVFSQVDNIEPPLFSSVVRNIPSTSAIVAVAWAPEVSEKNLGSFIEKYRGFGFDQAALAARLLEFERLFPISMASGSSLRLQQGLELNTQPLLAEGLNRALEQGRTVPIVSAETSSRVSLELINPVVTDNGEGLGVLVAEIDLAKLVAMARGDLSESLRVALYPSGTPEGNSPLWSDGDLSKAQRLVAQVPVAISDQKWEARFYSNEQLPAVFWEAALAGLLGLASTLSIVMYCRALFSRAAAHQDKADENAQSLKLKEQAYRESMQRLEKAEERYRDLFEKSQALIWTQDENGILQALNPACADSLGYQTSEMKGRSLKDFIIPTERHTFPQYLDRCRNQETSKGLLKLYTKNGATRFWMYQTSLTDEAGDISVRCHALDVTESQQAERELERLSRRNELILESVGEGVYGINLAGECSFVNPAALKFTGHSREELMKAVHTMHEILQPQREDGSDYPWEESPSYATLNDGEVRRVKAETMWRKDGSRFPVDYVVTPIVEDDERILGAVVTFQDVTERRAIEQMKNEFISIVSHELRTPLTSIRGSLGLLASGLLKKFPDKADKMLKIAVENTDRLVRLINDILDIERLESGKVTVEQQECDLAGLMLGASETMQAMANDNGVRLVVEPFQTKVWADSDRCLQVLTNLLSNAIKFSNRDGEVKLFAEPTESENGSWVKISVKDNGRGIPPEAIGKIFERFGQVDASDSREKGGTGLGLPICKTIVEQHGGMLWVESEMGQGSTFIFTLPTQPPASADAEPATSAEIAS